MSDMESFDDEGNMKFILEEIHKTDTFYNSFKKEFYELIFNIIQEFHPEVVQSSELENLLLAYSVAILNSTESVIDKDRNYPFYRLEEELDTMSKLTLKLSQSADIHDFAETIHLKVKSMMVKYFDDIYNLSSTGFRLLEKNTRLYNWEFASNFPAISSSVRHTPEN